MAVLRRLGRRMAQKLRLEMRAGGLLVFAGRSESTYECCARLKCIVKFHDLSRISCVLSASRIILRQKWFERSPLYLFIYIMRVYYVLVGLCCLKVRIYLIKIEKREPQYRFDDTTKLCCIGGKRSTPRSFHLNKTARTREREYVELAGLSFTFRATF